MQALITNIVMLMRNSYTDQLMHILLTSLYAVQCFLCSQPRYQRLGLLPVLLPDQLIHHLPGKWSVDLKCVVDASLQMTLLHQKHDMHGFLCCS